MWAVSIAGCERVSRRRLMLERPPEGYLLTKIDPARYLRAKYEEFDELMYRLRSVVWSTEEDE